LEFLTGVIEEFRISNDIID